MRYVFQLLSGIAFKLNFLGYECTRYHSLATALRYSLIGIGMIGAIACAPLPTILQTTTDEDTMTMISTSGVIVHSVSLMAREEINPPYGDSADNTRDIGFATVFFTLENTTEENYSIAVSIAVKDAETGAVQMQMEWPEPLLLRPLEYSEQAVHLSNTAGFDGSQAIAVLTCQIGADQVVLESAPVTVEQY